MTPDQAYFGPLPLSLAGLTTAEAPLIDAEKNCSDNRGHLRVPSQAISDVEQFHFE